MSKPSARRFLNENGIPQCGYRPGSFTGAHPALYLKHAIDMVEIIKTNNKYKIKKYKIVADQLERTIQKKSFLNSF